MENLSPCQRNVRRLCAFLALLLLAVGIASATDPIRRRRLGGGGFAPLAAHTVLTAASTQYWSAADNAAVSMGSGIDFTFAGWLNFASFTGGQSYGFASKWGGSGHEYILEVGGTSKQVTGFISSNGTAFVTSLEPTVMTAGLWYFVVLRYDGTNRSISVNNVAFTSTAYSADCFDGTNALDFGSNAAGDSFPNVSLSAWGIWKSAHGAGGALSAAQITELYNNRRARPYRGLTGSLKANLAAYWDFEADGNDRAGVSHLINNGGATFAAGGPF